MSRQNLKPTDDIKAWDTCKVHERIDDCRFLLKVHGFLSEAESDRVLKRMDRWLRLHGYRRVVKTRQTVHG